MTGLYIYGLAILCLFTGFCVGKDVKRHAINIRKENESYQDGFSAGYDTGYTNRMKDEQEGTYTPKIDARI